MANTSAASSINIRPGVSILSVLRHLNYKPWYAMAEFVDNSVQSYLSHREAISRVDGPNPKLHVNIQIDPGDNGQITIRDNAAGIFVSEYERAFRTAAAPPDKSGLSEFGMGMKSAACWFANKWTVRSSALGENVERTVAFDIASIVQAGQEELVVTTRLAPVQQHYTEITLSDLHKPPQGRTLGKIKEHLASIYRIFIREGLLELRFDGELLSYAEPAVLVAPYYKDQQGRSVEWKKLISIDLGEGLKAHGFAALRQTGSTADAGFALFRRDRLIQGSADEGYRPTAIFGRSNSYTYQRLFGELHLEGFEVSHTKDGFRWEEHEDDLLEHLKVDLNEQPLPLLDQAEGYRVRPRTEDIKTAVEQAIHSTAEAIKRDAPRVLERLDGQPEAGVPPTELPRAKTASRREIKVTLHGEEWEIILELSDDPAVGAWVELFDQQPGDPGAFRPKPRRVGVRLSLAHPFTERFGGVDASDIEPLVRLAAAIGLAETAARDSGVRSAGTFRRNINELLRDALSKP